VKAVHVRATAGAVNQKTSANVVLTVESVHVSVVNIGMGRATNAPITPKPVVNVIPVMSTVAVVCI